MRPMEERLQRGVAENNRKLKSADMEDMVLDREYKPMGYLNEQKGIFTGKMQSGINTGESVFDATAVFKVSQQNRNNHHFEAGYYTR